MKKLLILNLILIFSVSCKQKTKSQTGCTNDDCSRCEEITLDVFTGFRTANCQDENNWDFEVVESLNDNSDLCGVTCDYYKINSRDYPTELMEMVSCDNDRDYYIFRKVSNLDKNIVQIERFKAYTRVDYRDYVVVVFKVTQENNALFYWAGKITTPNKDEAYTLGENHIAKAKKPKYKWGTDRNWRIRTDLKDIKPNEIFESMTPVNLID